MIESILKFNLDLAFSLDPTLLLSLGCVLGVGYLGYNLYQSLYVVDDSLTKFREHLKNNVKNSESCFGPDSEFQLEAKEVQLNFRLNNLESGEDIAFLQQELAEIKKKQKINLDKLWEEYDMWELQCAAKKKSASILPEELSLQKFEEKGPKEIAKSILENKGNYGLDTSPENLERGREILVNYCNSHPQGCKDLSSFVWDILERFLSWEAFPQLQLSLVPENSFYHLLEAYYFHNLDTSFTYELVEVLMAIYVVHY